MGQRSDSRTVGLSLALFVVATNSFAQAPNRATRYLFPTDVTDARALWVNPAGLGAFPEASINLDVTERARPARDDDDLQIPAFLRRQAN